ncbi:hypothetical protein L6J37_13225 [Photobacterium sp. WH77]|uniref:GHMP family kinase ATP-binding protein n=1 Tax=unclassified Photobacterium TaxID=2628852 RepID=UPI001C48E682|nr:MULTISPECIES: hypothetical protein [unclassified Photobacterium]MBV7262664.1 hypothetical protein [Photobacterium sp. WH24]MCG2837793.1 hypothetical protein [Photobacterium sp. WH77]MCG2845409.1 hypothetical protein [Photobacterium sp. WH80]MDO6582191.1 hypothetical protein [Photobacterium sp. 2_MG-2023]
MSSEILAEAYIINGVEHSCPISIGELIQGKIKINGNLVNFLVSVPVQSKRTAKIFMVDKHVRQDKYLKAYKAIHMLKKKFGIKDNLVVEIDSPSNIIPSKGFSTSSADIVATCRAFFKLYALPDRDDVILNILKNIERSDPVLYYKPSIFLQSECILLGFINLPNLQFIVVDDGGFHDTSNSEIEYSENEIKNFDDMVKTLLSENELSINKLYNFSLQSSQINQRVLNKSCLKELIEISEMFHVGVSVAHSGTVAFLYFPVNEESEQLTNSIQNELYKRGLNIYSYFHSIKV